MAHLFEPIEVGGLRLANRIVIAPMCQYSAVDGAMTDWHQMHLGQLALSGAGALTIEATAVSPEGRITYGDIGLYDDRTEAAMRSVLESVRRWSDMPLVIVCITHRPIGSTWTHRNQIRNPPSTAPRLLPEPPTITITQIRKVKRSGL